MARPIEETTDKQLYQLRPCSGVPATFWFHRMGVASSQPSSHGHGTQNELLERRPRRNSNRKGLKPITSLARRQNPRPNQNG
jgi:hypothetical protein